MTVDTLSLAKELREAELSPTQAEAIAAAIGRSVLEGSATKADLMLARTELKADLSSVRTELKADIESLEHRLTAKLEAFRSSMRLWFIGTQIAVGGSVAALVKL